MFWGDQRLYTIPGVGQDILEAILGWLSVANV